MADRTYRVVNRAFLGLFAMLGLRFEIRGAQHLPTRGPAVVACNHVSYLDFAFVELIARSRGRFVRFLAKRSVFTMPVAGSLMRAMGHVPVDRRAGAAAYREAARLLRDGEVVGIFPEATISRSWMLKRFKPGAAALAVECGIPIIPVVVWGGHRVVTVDRRYSLRRGKAVTIIVGPAYYPKPGESVEQVLAHLRIRMAGLLVEAQDGYPDRPNGPDDHWWIPAERGGTAPTIEEAEQLDAKALTRRHAYSAATRSGSSRRA